MKNIAGIRKDYILERLNESETEANPLVQFEKWWQQAVDSNIDEINAMALSTVDEDSKPSSRIVLLKGFDENGFTFFTNYESKKSTCIQINPYVALVFFWRELERQVRIEGKASKVSEEVSDTYFNSRPEASKIGAWASPQSRAIPGRSLIEQNEANYKIQFAESDIPRPQHWGGFVVKPSMIEFWQGRASRLHDRIRYSLLPGGNWEKDRLAP